MNILPVELSFLAFIIFLYKTVFRILLNTVLLLGNLPKKNCIFQKITGKGNSKRKNSDLRNCNFENVDLKRSVFAFCIEIESVFSSFRSSAS